MDLSHHRKIVPRLTEKMEAGIDWLTFYPEGDEAKEHVRTLVEYIQQEDVRNGSRKDAFHFQGCKGWATASVRHGSSTTTEVLQTSGRVATSIAARVASCSGYATRLDVQCTLYLKQPLSDFVSRARRPSPIRLQQRRGSQTLLGDSSRSDGLRIGTEGKRTWARYLRVYDKGVEERSADPETVWRMEVETKYNRARALWDDFRQTENPTQWSYSRCEALWRSAGFYWPLPNSGDARDVRAVVARRDPSVQLLSHWIQRSVAPTMPRLLTVFTVEEVLAFLGLQDVAQATARMEHELRP